MASITILVVDDDFLVGLDTAEAFREAGFVVVVASDAASALSELQTQPSIQLVCTDVNMPGELDGVDLALLVRDQYPQTKVIVISAMSQNRDRLPSVPFVPKPYCSSRLVALASEQLGNTQ